VGEELKGLAVSIVLGGLTMMALYAVVQRLARSWWIWGSLVAVALTAFFTLIEPVLISPILQSCKEAGGSARGRSHPLARARQRIGTGEVWEIDASKQSRRISANVTGFLGRSASPSTTTS